MSEVVAEMPPPRRNCYQPLYPWALWFDGRVHRLLQGADFTVSVHQLQTQVGKMAKRRGLTVVTSTRPGELYIQRVMQP